MNQDQTVNLEHLHSVAAAAAAVLQSDCSARAAVADHPMCWLVRECWGLALGQLSWLLGFDGPAGVCQVSSKTAVALV